LATKYNGALYISGMPSLDSEGKFAPGTFEDEADTAWANVVAIAAASGYSSADFLYVQVLLADIRNYSDVNDWWRRQFPDPAEAPSRLTFQAGALPFGAKVENTSRSRTRPIDGGHRIWVHPAQRGLDLGVLAVLADQRRHLVLGVSERAPISS
jgi:2-iminobutanoate/2-iminopropanoate deaminase